MSSVHKRAAAFRSSQWLQLPTQDLHKNLASQYSSMETQIPSEERLTEEEESVFFKGLTPGES